MQGFEDVPKRQIEAKIKTIAVKEKRGSDAVSLNFVYYCPLTHLLNHSTC